jgi:precorrin-4/cobalt-precorrin-4 C11-methyltransferase
MTDSLISFVGAGPGAADLLTLRAVERIRHADLILWPSSLVPAEVLAHASPAARVHDTAGLTLEDQLAIYQSHPGSSILRLHSGDPSLYGALYEQVIWCESVGRPYEIVPGVSSVSAAAAVLGRELTVPGISQSVILTRLASRTRASLGPAESLGALAAHGLTMAIFLAGARGRQLQEELTTPPSSFADDTPAAVVVRASQPEQQVLWCRLRELASTMAATGTDRTMLVLVGPALAASEAGRSGSKPVGSDSQALSEQPPELRELPVSGRSHLYHPDFAHGFRKRSAAGDTTGRPVSKRARPDRGRNSIPDD